MGLVCAAVLGFAANPGDEATIHSPGRRGPRLQYGSLSGGGCTSGTPVVGSHAPSLGFLPALAAADEAPAARADPLGAGRAEANADAAPSGRPLFAGAAAADSTTEGVAATALGGGGAIALAVGALDAAGAAEGPPPGEPAEIGRAHV